MLLSKNKKMRIKMLNKDGLMQKITEKKDTVKEKNKTEFKTYTYIQRKKV